MKRKIAWMLVFVLGILMLTGCDNSPYVGEWRFVSGTFGGKEITEKELEEETGGPLGLILEKNGNAVLVANGKRARSKWEENDDGIIVYDRTNKSKSTTYIYKDDMLICTVSGNEMRMKKK